MKKINYCLIAIFMLFSSLLIIDNVNALSMGRVTNETGVNIRSGPGTSYSLKAGLKYNDVVPLISTGKYTGSGCSAGWYKINHNGNIRYVCSSYVSTSTYTAKVNNSGSVNIRNGAGTNYSIYTKFNNNKLVTLSNTGKFTGTGCSNGWYSLNYNAKKTRYICSTYTKNYNSNSNVMITNTGGVNVREKATTNSSSLVYLKYGQALSLDSTKKYTGTGCSNGWYKVYYQGKEAYVCSSFVTNSKNLWRINDLNTGAYIRSKPSSNSTKIATLKYSTTVALENTTINKSTGGCSSGWYKITVNGKTGYVCKTYVTDTNLSTNAASGVNVRTGAGTGYSKITYLNKGDLVLLSSTTKYKGTGCSSGWYKISINAKTGYVCSSYTELGKSSSSNSSSKTVTKLTTPDKNTYYTTNKWTYKVNENYATVRTSAGGSQKELIYLGTEIKPISTSGDYTKISYYNGRTGYILTRLLDKYNEVTKTNSTYCNQLKAKGFPESYCPYLSYLHAKHPNWIFKAEKTGINFTDAIDGELSKNYTQIEEDEYLNSWKIQESGNWREASSAYIAYLLDPRNYLNDTNIYAFEDLSYDSVNQTKSVVRSIVDGSYLDTDTYASYFVNAGKTYDVSPVHLAARVKQEGGTNSSYAPVSGKVTTKWNVTNSGYVCGSSSYGTKSGTTFKVKSGTNLNVRSGAGTGYKKLTYPNGNYITANSNDTLTISKTYSKGNGCSGSWYKVKINKSLKGIYNYYNIGAYGDNPTIRGLAAAAGYVDDLDGTPWNTRKKAITYGAKFIADGYINAGQNTLYYQKFNTGPNSDYSPFTHQYMTNIIAPSSESLSTYYSYDDLNIDSKALTFTIPVYNNMPTKTSHPPIGSISAHLNALK